MLVDMEVPENLVWLISSNKDQSMLMLHQFRHSFILACMKIRNHNIELNKKYKV